MKNLTPRLIFALTFLAGAGLVGGGLYLAIKLNLAACPLCILQRMTYMLLAAASLLALLAPRARPVQFGVALFNALAAATGAFIAGYQVWLQRFAEDTTCARDLPWWEQLVYWAGEKVPLLFEASGLCSDPAWKFLGLSIADWSLLAFSGLFVLALVALKKTVRAA